MSTGKKNLNDKTDISMETVFEEEQNILSENYEAYASQIQTLHDSFQADLSSLDNGGYEDPMRFSVSSTANRSLDKYNDALKIYQMLEPNPYFAHIELKTEDFGDEPETIHCFLSDCELLNNTFEIRGFEDKHFIFPFKQDSERGMLDILFHIYQDKSGNAVTDKQTTYTPVLIREDTIQEQKLVYAEQPFPVITSNPYSEHSDQLLLQKLEENRNSSVLKNIIASLQREQFDIIRKPADMEFVVQGCAGSGKSQILIHRLFYLRDTLKDYWDQVLLITPSTLFREHSSTLIQRYRLSSVKNLSLSKLYSEILLTVDPNFKNRQYAIKLSEEYLKPEYIREVYSSEFAERLEKLILEQINSHLDKISGLLETEYQNFDQDIILQDLDAEIKNIETLLAQKPVIQEDLEEKREKHRRLTLFNAKLEERKLEIENRRKDVISKLEDIDDLRKALNNHKKELEQIQSDDNKKKSSMLKAINDLVTSINHGTKPDPAKVIHFFQMYAEFLDFTDPYSETNREHNSLLAAIQMDIADLKQNFTEKTGQTDPDKYCADLDQELQKCYKDYEQLLDVLEPTKKEETELAEFLESQNAGIDRKKLEETLKALRREQNFIQRIESSIFDQIIWEELGKIKKEHSVRTEKQTTDQAGHIRTDKILYKADLLYYLQLYILLNKTNNLPVFKLICIDEGQDLQSVDYKLLRRLFPKATFNVFGDINQVLYPQTGISDWMMETQINRVYELNCNYRSSPEIVFFCNNILSTHMKYIGTASKNKIPLVIYTKQQLTEFLQGNQTYVVILKDKNAFEELQNKTRYTIPFEFIDCNSKIGTSNAIKCYTVFAAKGLEFENVLVYTQDMERHFKIIACTRALKKLVYFFEGKPGRQTNNE